MGGIQLSRSGRGTATNLFQCIRGSVAAWIALMSPAMVGALAMGIEIGGWAAAQVSVQRAADVSAIAGAINYSITSNKQIAATFATRMAQLNGAAGTAAPSWNASTSTVTNNQITAQVVAGLQNASSTALKVTVQRAVPKSISQFFSDPGAVTITATSTAELIYTSTNGSGGTPCVIALGTAGLIAGYSIVVDGSSNMNAATCTIRSNDGLRITGSSVVSTVAAYLGGTLNNDSSSFNGSLYQNQGQIPDPYANRDDLQTALTAANSASGSAKLSCTGNNNCSPSNKVSCSGGVCTAQPGTYSGMQINSGVKLVLAPGLYVFTGNATSSSAQSIVGNNVTILMSAGSKLTIDSNSVSLSAATTNSATNGQIPGIIFASTSTTNSKITGTSSVPLVGVIYYPKGNFEVDGSSDSGNAHCSVLIAKSIKLTGSSSFEATNCGDYNVPTIFSIAGTSGNRANLVK